MKAKIRIEDVVEFLPKTGKGGIDAIVRQQDGTRAVESLCNVIDFCDSGKAELLLEALEYYRKHVVLHQDVTTPLLEAGNA